ncbi:MULTISPECIES: protein kinase [unclassified Streptomyces]|uniref:protein kinase domain-containing protein n=1 Tax=unclassified Streptomyces TaxID=2593676 RepID=UPI00336A02EE
MAGMKLYSLESNDPPRLGPYRLLRRIATGGMGRIYLARQEAPGTAASAAGPTGTVVDHGLVAVKTLLAEGFVSRPDRERFAREVELAGRVDSAYTATVLDANPKAERPWLAIEFIPAPSLGELVVSAGTLPTGAVRRIAAGAARALVELHGLGVVHRDIKPLNILLPHDGPRLIDFGISHAHDHTSSTTTIGTFAFTSPEQACGKKSTAASDLYSLGATLFFLAVGRPPYEQTDHPFGVLALVQRGELDTSGLPPELEPLILPLLRVDPGSRPTPSDLLRDVLADLDQGTADLGAEQRLPQAWTELIEEYAEQGRQLRSEAVDFAAAEAPTQVRSEGAPERADEALSEMREQLEALRKQRDALMQAQAEEQAEAAARELARREEEERRHREQARKDEAERRERERKDQERREKERKEKERRERERKERERKEREQKEKQRKERERIAHEKTETATKNKSTGTASTPKATPKSGAAKQPAKSTGSSESWGGLLLVALIIGALIWHPWDKKDDDTPSSSPSSRVTLSSSSGTTSGLGDDDSDSGTDSGTDTDSSSSSSSGGVDDTETEPEPEPETTSPEPEPDPTEEAFKAVSYGDCLDVVDTGYGGTTKYDWSEEEPNTTSCGYGTRVKVTGTTGDCPSGVGKATWSYYSTSSGERTELCLTGQYRQGDCLLAKHEGNNVSSIAMLSSPNCTDRRVPVPYNEILVVTDIYRATGAGAEVCRHGQYDSNTYWSTEVDDGATMLCMKAYD